MDGGIGAKTLFRRLLIVVPVIGAALVVAAMVRSKRGPEERPAREVARQVRVVTATPMAVAPRAVGYGQVRPGREWQVVPEVSGRVVWVAPAFKKGGLVREGEVLLRIDPVDYELAVRQMSANIAKIEAQLAELSRREKNLRATLKIQRAVLSLSEKELDRNRRARASGSISDSALDQARINYQNSRSQVQEVENELALIPASRSSLSADLAYNRSRLEEAGLDLSRCAMEVPYDCRVTEADAEVGQYVQQGQTVGRADGIDRAEIYAQLPISVMRTLLSGAAPEAISLDRETMEGLSMERLRSLFGLTVRVGLVSAGFDVRWEARFARADATIDPQTRTVGVIVAVDDPYGKAVVGRRPPLVRNMFCNVEISGRPLPDRMAVPRAALHDGGVYVVGEGGRLARKPVTVEFSQGDFHVLSGGLSEGDTVVVSDLVPAIEGMLLAPVPDEATALRMKEQLGVPARTAKNQGAEE